MEIYFEQFLRIFLRLLKIIISFITLREMIIMTVGSKVKQTLATLNWIEGTLRIYSETSESAEEKSAFEKSLKVTQGVIGDLKFRVRTLENEEPQYKGL